MGNTIDRLRGISIDVGWLVHDTSCPNRALDDDCGVLQIRQFIQLLKRQARRFCGLQGEFVALFISTFSELGRLHQPSARRAFWVQGQDGKVMSGTACELSELMKRRLESVASTGSSASSGFIEDKSYCDSEEEEEGKSSAFLTAHSAVRSSVSVCSFYVVTTPTSTFLLLLLNTIRSTELPVPSCGLCGVAVSKTKCCHISLCACCP